MTDADPRVDAPPRKPGATPPEYPLLAVTVIAVAAVLAVTMYALIPKLQMWDPSADWKLAIACALFLAVLVGPLRKSLQLGRRGGTNERSEYLSRREAFVLFGRELARCAALAAFLSALALALVCLFPSSPPPMEVKARCADHLRQLAALHVTEVMETGLPVRRGGGAAYVLAWRTRSLSE